MPVRSIFCIAAVFAACAAGAVPQLKQQPELVAGGELKAKVLAASHGVPAATPEARHYTLRRGGEEKRVKWYVPADVWRARAYAGEWKDRKGNVMRLARVKSLVPEFERPEWFMDEIEKGLDALEKDFKGTDGDLAKWKDLWGGEGVGRFVTVAKTGAIFYVEFKFAEKVKDADAQKLLKAFEKSVSTVVSGSSGISSMKWWSESNERYEFLTDLDRAKGGKFIKDTMKLMDAMRKAYEFYVPPSGTVGKCRVRVFKTLAGYREYRASTGDEDETSCGLWDPSREELLVAAEDRERALETMRHEAFHQYLFYATLGARHAMWFNEGHACFFENVRYNPARNTVKVLDTGSRAEWVAKDPGKVARSIRRVLAMGREGYYSGSLAEINHHYVTGWAVVYFLEKGVYADEEFAPYRGICAKYLELTGAGMDAAEATDKAWSLVDGRDVAADFLKFWSKYRKQAAKAR